MCRGGKTLIGLFLCPSKQTKPVFFLLTQDKVSEAWDFWKKILPVETEVKSWSTLTLPVRKPSLLHAITFPVPFSSGHMFSVVFLLLQSHLWESLLFPFTSLAITVQLGFGFTKPILACTDGVYIFLPGHLTLFPLLDASPFLFEFCQELLVHLYRPLATFAWLPPTCVDGQFFSLEKVILGNTLYLLLPSSLQAHRPWHTLELVPERTKDCFPEFQAYNPNFCLALSSLASHDHCSQGCLQLLHPWPVPHCLQVEA